MNFSLPKFDFSLRKRENAEKKNYFIDNGLINALSFKFSDDYGMLLENCIFLHLRRQYKEQVFYFKDNKECDFVIFEKNKVQQLIQVCYDVEDNETLKREVESLKYACKKLGVTEGTIVTFDNIENELLEDGIQIEFIPAWKFVLGYNF